MEVSYDSMVWLDEEKADVTVGDARNEVFVTFNEFLNNSGLSESRNINSSKQKHQTLLLG